MVIPVEIYQNAEYLDNQNPRNDQKVLICADGEFHFTESGNKIKRAFYQR